MTAPATETKTARLDLKAGPSGEFTVRFATKRDAAGELVIDHDGDVYADGAIGEQPIHVGCWNHGSCSGPAGTGRTFETRSDIRAAGQLLMNTQAGREEHARWTALGAAAEFSYQYRVKDFDRITVRGRPVRRLKSLEVISVDLVARGAGINTGIVALKSACGCPGDGDLRELAAAAKATLARYAPAPPDASAEELRELVQESKRLLDPYPEVPERDVSPKVATAAREAVAKAAAAVDIEIPRIRWFRHNVIGGGKASRKGFSFELMPGEGIFLHAGLPVSAAPFVAAHEVAHLVGAPTEEDADQFARGLGYSYGRTS